MVDAAVFGVPNDDFGEEVKAVVQPVEVPAHTDETDRLARELIAYWRTELADVKCPRSVDFRADLRRHPTGKRYKRLLQSEEYAKPGVVPHGGERRPLDGLVTKCSVRPDNPKCPGHRKPRDARGVVHT